MRVRSRKRNHKPLLFTMIRIKTIPQFLSCFMLLFFVQTINAQDWANLERFKAKNSMLTSPKENETRVVLMGNSITEGWSNSRPDFFKDKPYINRGISGQTTPQMLVRFRQDVIALAPTVVVILAGINDIAGNTGPSSLEMIANNIFSMAELAQTHNIKVVLCSVLPAYDFPWSPGLKPAPKVVKLNAMIKQYALENKFVYLDYFVAMANQFDGLKKELGYDGVHPNAAGYATMEPLLEAAIKQAITN